MKKLLYPTSLKRILFFIITDFVLISFSFYISFLLRFSLSLPSEYVHILIKTFVVFTSFKVMIFYLLGLYKFQWRYFSLQDQIKLVYVSFLSTVLFYLLAMLLRNSYFEGFPRSILAVEFFISIFLLFASRVSKRVILSLFSKNALAKATLIVGVNSNTEQLLVRLQASSEYRPIAILDNNKDLKNISIYGVQVLHADKLDDELLEEVTVAIITDESSIKSLDEIYQFLESKNINNIKILDDFLENKIEIRDITVEDLLARHPQDLDKEKIENFIKDKTILVTGAGGSIGSEICRQCVKYGARKLIVLDHSEFNLYAILEELSDIEVFPVMQSVTDLNNLDKTFEMYKPQIVIHAAAYKHVPLVESNINEGIVNNVIGTKNVIDSSIKHNVEKFVMISTDKAVRPTNVMGTTKRICELYAQNSNGKGTDIVAVRFGNVLGSSGSVIPKFKKQIEEGGPITVTHPDITRYFMLIPEACELVLQAGAIGSGGEIFILDMGEPIKIVDLAKKMCELSGRKDIEIVFSGLRPGEKLYEELLIDDTDCTTQYKSITVAKPTSYDLEQLNQDIEKLLASEDKIAKLKEIVPEFNHQLN